MRAEDERVTRKTDEMILWALNDRGAFHENWLLKSFQCNLSYISEVGVKIRA